MAEQVIDRITVAFANPQELADSRALRKKAGARGVNRLLKQILRQWLEQNK